MNSIKRFYSTIPLWGRIPILIIIIGALIWILIPADPIDRPTAVVQRGEFIVDIKETGRLRAENSVTITAPPVRMQLQIIYLIPEGSQVEEGDILIQFETTEFHQQIEDELAALEIEQANLTSRLISMESRMMDLESSLKNSQASYRLAELRLAQMQFESSVQIEEGELNLLQAELALRRAEEDLRSQQQIDSAEVRSLKLKIRQTELDLEKSRRDMERMTIRAPAPGLVVYKETWKGSEMAKVKVGDSPWRGMALLELPDLSVMMVESAVSEVDVGKVEVGQQVEVKLDAYPDPVFVGEVVDVALLASSEGSSEAQMFEILIRLKGSDPLFRPGMSASARIIIDRFADQLFIPIEAVFHSEGKTIVWRQNGSDWEKQELVLGVRNDNFVVADSGLEEGAVVALVDPTLVAEEREIQSTKEVTDKEENAPNASNSKPSPRFGRRRRG